MVVNADELDAGPHDAFYTLDGVPFTGTAIERINGVKVWEASFQEGLNHGWEKSWFTDGKFCDKTDFNEGKPQGRARAWHPNGQLCSETFFVNGDLASKTRWDENGEVISNK